MGKEGHSVGEKAARVGSTKGGLASSAKCGSTVESEHKMCRLSKVTTHERYGKRMQQLRDIMVLIKKTEAKQSPQTVAPEYLRGKIEAFGLFFTTSPAAVLLL